MLGAPLDYLFAFLVGGLVCLFAQLLIDLTKLTPARILVIYVVLGVALGAVGLFEPLADFAGCGITVPLIGFGGNVARGVRVAVSETGLLGALTGGLSAASGGTAAALCFGYLVALFCNARPKRP
ncbi:MAG: SpoVA/SpoVAEb family sporulation membrane protein [Clostridia bacterium]|nr:SpoVA/SpoVAEb family sporulation membrane protein [Clostridia bacterium]